MSLVPPYRRCQHGARCVVVCPGCEMELRRKWDLYHWSDGLDENWLARAGPWRGALWFWEYAP